MYTSPSDIRVLGYITDDNPLGYVHVLYDIRNGRVVKRFRSVEDRDAYLARNGYTAR